MNSNGVDVSISRHHRNGLDDASGKALTARAKIHHPEIASHRNALLSPTECFPGHRLKPSHLSPSNIRRFLKGSSHFIQRCLFETNVLSQRFSMNEVKIAVKTDSPDEASRRDYASILGAIWASTGIFFVVSLCASVVIYCATATEHCPKDEFTTCEEDFTRCSGDFTCYCPFPYYYDQQDPYFQDWKLCREIKIHLPPIAEICFITTRALTFIGLFFLFFLFIYGRFLKIQ